ncbi:MAG: MOSC domain-containing protein [Promethearchaeota archaeon]
MILKGKKSKKVRLLSSKGIINAVCISKEKGVVKRNVGEAKLIKNYGIEGDAHASSKWHRQVSLLSTESMNKMKKQLPDKNITYGSFGENLNVEGIILHTLPVGTLLKAGETLLEVSQIGKECHSPCEIGRTTGYCVMPEEGIFVRVLKGGKVKVGASVIIIH